MLRTNATLIAKVLLALLALAGGAAWAGEQVTYYHDDLAGSPLAATDARGYIMWRSTYEPYGHRIQGSADYNASVQNNRWFTSHVEDVQTGTVTMGARHYDPLIGRFLSVDPVRFNVDQPHTFARYTYGANNPYLYRDPDGEDPETIFGFLMGVVHTEEDARKNPGGRGSRAHGCSRRGGCWHRGQAAGQGDSERRVTRCQASDDAHGRCIAGHRQEEGRRRRVRPPNMAPGGSGRQGAFNAAKRANGIPTSQQPTRTLPNVDSRGKPQPGRIYEFEVPAAGGGKRTIQIRDDAAGHEFPDDPSQNRGSHFNDPAGDHYDYDD